MIKLFMLHPPGTRIACLGSRPFKQCTAIASIATDFCTAHRRNRISTHTKAGGAPSRPELPRRPPPCVVFHKGPFLRRPRQNNFTDPRPAKSLVKLRCTKDPL